VTFSWSNLSPKWCQTIDATSSEVAASGTASTETDTPKLLLLVFSGSFSDTD
jgi:hypothetical protein